MGINQNVPIKFASKHAKLRLQLDRVYAKKFRAKFDVIVVEAKKYSTNARKLSAKAS